MVGHLRGVNIEGGHLGIVDDGLGLRCGFLSELANNLPKQAGFFRELVS